MLLPCTGSAAFCNKLDALLFVLLLEVGCSDQPLQDLAAYNEMVINNVSDQGGEVLYVCNLQFQITCCFFPCKLELGSCPTGVELELGNAPDIDTAALLNDTAMTLQTTARTSSSTTLELEDDTAAAAATVVVESDPPASEEIESVSPADCHRTRVSRLYPNSRPTPDMKHIVDNLLGECLDCMPSMCLARTYVSCKNFLPSCFFFRPKLTTPNSQPSLPRWPFVSEGLHALERLLRTRTMRELFIYSCLGVDHPCAKEFDKWSYSLVSLRWEAIEEFTRNLLEREQLIRQHWDKKRFMGGMAPKQKQLHSTTDLNVTIDAIDLAVRNPTFWSCARLINDLSFSAEFVGRWCEGCPCCSELQTGSCRKRQRTKWLINVHTSASMKCPYKGCRAVDMAAGDWQSKLQLVLADEESRLNQSIACSEDSQQSIYLSQWTKARSTLWSQIRMKLSFFQQLPWRLCFLPNSKANC